MSTITISSAAIDGTPEVVSLQGREGLSDLYQFEVGVRFNDVAFDYEAAINERATLKIDRGEGCEPFEFAGVLASIELLHSFGTSELYRMVIVPELWKLTLTRHSRVFTDNTIVEIIKAVLGEAKITGDSKVKFEVQASKYKKREFVAMYKESYYDFISRWMEREGMFFYFRHKDGQEQLVITDREAETEGLVSGDVRYVPLSDESAMPSEALASFRCKSRMLPQRVEMADYNYQKPNLKRISEGATVASGGHGQVIMYGHNCVDPDEAFAYAAIRGKAHLAAQNVFTGWGQVFDLRSGYPFMLDGHPRLNQKYLVVGLEHYCCHLDNGFLKDLLEIDSEFAKGDYGCRVRAIPSNVAYKTPERMVWPRIEGYEHATICGEATSEYAQLDDQGRYTIQFYFDESDLPDGKKSCLVRLQQPYGGGHEGFHFNLVKGTEVAVYFAGGDPDRPMICGVSPNPQKQSPTNVECNTLNKITTINDNRIWIEDNSGQQFVYVYCPIEETYLHFGVELGGFNLILNTEGHAHFHIGGDQVIDVDITLTETVIDDVTFNYNNNWYINVVTNNDIEIGAELNIHVVGNVTYNFDAIWGVTILGDHNYNLTGNLDIHVGGTTVEVYDNNVNIDVTGDYIVNVTGNTNHTVTNNYDFSVNSNYTQNITANYTSTVNNSLTVNVAGPTTESFWDVHCKINGGITSDTFIGLKNENLIGGKLETLVGMKIEMAMAMFVEMKLGFALKVAGALEFECNNPKISALQTKIEAVAGPRVLNGLIWLETNGLAVFT